MKWQDEGVVLSTRTLGESSLVVTVLTPTQGRHAGLIRHSKTAKNRTSIQPGNFVQAAWSARLPDHLGTWTFETLKTPSARLLCLPSPLAALSSACIITDQCLAERHPYPEIYEALCQLIEELERPEWLSHYIYYELTLLQHLGFALDLTSCASTGQTEDLIYVSPKSARAVSREAGAPYIEHLLPLPAFLLTQDLPSTQKDVTDALSLTGYFLAKHLMTQHGLPTVRQRLSV